MTTLVQYNSASESSDSDDCDELINSKRQKLNNLIQKKKYESEHPDDAADNANSIRSCLPPPKSESQKGLTEIEHAKLSHRLRVLGGGIKNQFNGARVMDFDDASDDADESKPTDSGNSLMFLPRALLKKKPTATKTISAQPATKEALHDAETSDDVEFEIDSAELFPPVQSLNTRVGAGAGAGAGADNKDEPRVRDAAMTRALNDDSGDSKSELKFKTGNIPQNAEVIDFNVDAFYEENRRLQAAGELEDSSSKKSLSFNANGPNQLATLVKFASDETNQKVLQQKFETEKQAKQRTKKKYGW